jgi:hypothetical protein
LNSQRLTATPLEPVENERLENNRSTMHGNLVPIWAGPIFRQPSSLVLVDIAVSVRNSVTSSRRRVEIFRKFQMKLVVETYERFQSGGGSS